MYTSDRNHPFFEVAVPTRFLLLRADFVLGEQGNPVMFKRWRRVLTDALPRLLGCANRAPTARVRLRGSGRFSAWVRIPVQRRPGARRVRALTARLRQRLEAALLPVGGRVLKLAIRRYRVPPVIAPLPAWTGPCAVVCLTTESGSTPLLEVRADLAGDSARPPVSELPEVAAALPATTDTGAVLTEAV
jgi:hypothetical protein